MHKNLVLLANAQRAICCLFAPIGGRAEQSPESEKRARGVNEVAPNAAAVALGLRSCGILLKRGS